MKGLLNEVQRLQKLAGILSENSINEDEYNDEWSNKIVKIKGGNLSGNQGEVVGAKAGELDVKITTMFGNPVRTVSEKDVKVIGSLDHDGPVTDVSINKQLDEKKKRKKKGPGLWANIGKQREDGEKPAHPNSKEYKDAVKAGKEINKSKK
jgi:hypothetical protein